MVLLPEPLNVRGTTTYFLSEADEKEDCDHCLRHDSSHQPNVNGLVPSTTCFSRATGSQSSWWSMGVVASSSFSDETCSCCILDWLYLHTHHHCQSTGRSFGGWEKQTAVTWWQ